MERPAAVERAAAARTPRASRPIDAAYEDKFEGRVDGDSFDARRAEREAQRAEAEDEIKSRGPSGASAARLSGRPPERRPMTLGPAR